MATNKIADGNILTLTAGAAVSSGDVVVAGDLVAIAQTDAAIGETFAAAITGAWTVAKVAGTAWAIGDSLDWDASASAFDKDIAVPAAGDVENCGVAYLAAASADVTGVVRLTPGTGTTT